MGLAQEISYLERLLEAMASAHYWPPKPTAADVHLHLDTITRKLADLQDAATDATVQAQIAKALNILKGVTAHRHP